MWGDTHTGPCRKAEAHSAAFPTSHEEQKVPGLGRYMMSCTLTPLFSEKAANRGPNKTLLFLFPSPFLFAFPLHCERESAQAANHPQRLRELWIRPLKRKICFALLFFSQRTKPIKCQLAHHTPTPPCMRYKDKYNFIVQA